MKAQHKTWRQKQTSHPITLTEIKNLVNGGTGVHTSQTAEDGIKTLLTYGFARLTSKNINAITEDGEVSPRGRDGVQSPRVPDTIRRGRGL